MHWSLLVVVFAVTTVARLVALSRDRKKPAEDLTCVDDEDETDNDEAPDEARSASAASPLAVPAWRCRRCGSIYELMAVAYSDGGDHIAVEQTMHRRVHGNAACLGNCGDVAPANRAATEIDDGLSHYLTATFCLRSAFGAGDVPAAEA